MTARELFEDGQLGEAIREQQVVVGKHPQDRSARLLLCEFLAFAGRFNEVLAGLDRFPESDEAFAGYLNGWREIVRADITRHRGDSPAFLMPPPKYVEWISTALETGDEETAGELMDRAMDSMPVAEGHVDGRSLEGCRDSDDRLAGFLECLIDGEYFQVPWEHLKKVRMDAIECLRDEMYRPATLTLTNGQLAEGFIPTRYAMREDTPDDLRCGFGTDYREEIWGMRGEGAKLLLLGEDELTFAEFTQLELKTAR